jgi:hypothetical protein
MTPKETQRREVAVFGVERFVDLDPIVNLKTALPTTDQAIPPPGAGSCGGGVG